MMSKLFKKAFTKGGSKLWQSFFWLSLIIKVIKWLFKKADPKVERSIELAPGEYSITVDRPQNKKVKK